jgi:large subunit ribosomal protein L9
MKVILTKDVARLGRKSEIKEVPDGHALNLLIPRNLAIAATSENVRKLKEENRLKDIQKEEALKAFKRACESLSKGAIRLSADANNKGHLFKGINAEDISKRLESEGIHVPPSQIGLTQPLKDIGVHQVSLSFGEAKGVCQLEIVKK